MTHAGEALGGGLEIGPRLGCQTLVVRSGGDGWRGWQDLGVLL